MVSDKCHSGLQTSFERHTGVVSSGAMATSSYHEGLGELERALVDVVRVGAAGNAAGVRQLGRRLLRRTPDDVGDSASFREAIGIALSSALADGPAGSLLRSAVAEELPVDGDSEMPLALLEPVEAAAVPVLADSVQERIATVIDEQLSADRLRRVGLQPTRTLLLSGPPGVGKTMTAHYVAATLRLPLLTVDLASVMSSYLGRTGQNLRAALDYGRTRNCVVFLDEFDAMAKRRDDDSDIGELKRLVNVLLLELERWPESSLLLAATNHPELLDRAVSRRFDVLIEMALPTEQERARMVTQVVTSGEWELSAELPSLIAAATDGYSGSDLVRLVTTALRHATIRDEPVIEHVLRVLMDEGRPTKGGRSRDRLCSLVVEHLKWSNRQTAAALGVSHPTVAKAIDRHRSA